MRLSPRIIQAMEILQLNVLALEERIDAELQSNPALEIQENEESSEEIETDDWDDRGERALVVADEGDNSDDFGRLDSMTREYGDDFFSESSPAPFRPRYGGDGDPKMEAMANTAAPEETLNENLHRQWMFTDTDEDLIWIGRAIIDAIAEDGYLRTGLDEIAASLEPPPPPEKLQEALNLVQKLEPVGVGARDLRECLLLQLAAAAEAGADVYLEMQLVGSFLREIEMNHLPLIARRTGRTIEEIKAAIGNIARLDPRPGLQVGQSGSPAIYPDAVVEVDDDGAIVVSIGDGRLPPLTISEYCLEKARDKTVDSSTRKFLKKNIRSGRWIVEAIAQRRRTLGRVIQEVFAVQRDFLDEGREALKPLPMADIAEKVGVHVATVSRAVADKYVQTPQGIFPLRMFFSGGTTTGEGREMSWEAVKEKLKDIVDGEDKSRPLNDEKLAAALRASGIDIARRTVAKYRKILGIPPARNRREY